MVSCHESKSSADISTTSPLRDVIRSGAWSSLTCRMSGNSRERASLALMVIDGSPRETGTSYRTIVARNWVRVHGSPHGEHRPRVEQAVRVERGLDGAV